MVWIWANTGRIPSLQTLEFVPCMDIPGVCGKLDFFFSPVHRNYSFPTAQKIISPFRSCQEKPIHPVTIDVDVVPSRQRCPTLHSKFCDLAQVFQFDSESFDNWNVIRSWGRLSIECKIASCPVRKIANYPACKVLRARSSAQAISQKSEVCAQFANCPGPCENVLKINNKIRGICKTILIWSWATWEYLKNL